MLRELNHGHCKTYLVACERTRRAALVDPLRERLDRYLALLAYHGLRLDYAIDTHTHADHRTGVFDLRELVDAKVVMHRAAPAPHVDIHVEDGETLGVGALRFAVLATPGHTPDSCCLHGEGHVLTGDTLLIGGTGRTDLDGGDAGAQYDAITAKLFALPEQTIVLPAHDYRGHVQSTIAEEKRGNLRISGRTRGQYVEAMKNLALPLPERLQEVLQPNQSALDDDALVFPKLAQLAEVRQWTPDEVRMRLAGAEAPLLLDVRERDEYDGELGHIGGSLLMPLRGLAARVAELEHWKRRPIVAVCRAGVRSTTAAAILSGLGFEQVANLKGGMLAWNELGLPVERAVCA